MRGRAVVSEDPRAVSFAFGRRLRELRTERGVSQDNLARATGLHRTTVGYFEQGRREPRLGTILRLARSMDLPPEAFVVGLDTTGRET
jgi:XRE family transcriptional regulator, regulator of sulfur utilization